MCTDEKHPELESQKPVAVEGRFAQKAHELLEGTVSGLVVTDEENRRLVKKIDCWLLPVMACAYLFQFLDKSCLTYAAITGLRDDLHLTGLDYSWAGSIYYFGYFIASYPASVLLVRFPVAKIISISLLLWGTILMLHATATNARSLLVLRFFLGLLEAPIAPALTLLISMFYTRPEQPLRQGAWFLGNSVAGLFGSLLGYAIGHVNGIAPWKAIFLVFGGATVAMSGVVAYALPDSLLNARFLATQERAKAVLRVRDNMTTLKGDKWKKSQMIEALTDPHSWFLVVIQMSCSIPNNGLITFGSIAIKGFGYSTLKAMLLNMIGPVFQLTLVIICTALSTYFRNLRTILMSLSMLLAVAGSVMVRQILVTHKVARLFGIGLTVSFSAAFPMIMAMTSSNVGGMTKKTTVSAMVFMGYCAGNIIGPYLFFEREAPGYSSGFLSMIVCFGISAATCLGLRFYLVWENKKRDKLQAEGLKDVQMDEEMNLVDRTDKEIPQFRYIY